MARAHLQPLGDVLAGTASPQGPTPLSLLPVQCSAVQCSAVASDISDMTGRQSPTCSCSEASWPARSLHRGASHLCLLSGTSNLQRVRDHCVCTKACPIKRSASGVHCNCTDAGLHGLERSSTAVAQAAAVVAAFWRAEVLLYLEKRSSSTAGGHCWSAVRCALVACAKARSASQCTRQ